MNSVSFFTPVVYEKIDKSYAEFFLEKVDDYFYLGGKKAEVFLSDPQERNTGLTVHLIEKRSALWATTLKIASYFTIILPLICLAIKAGFRHNRHFEVFTKDQVLQKQETEHFYVRGINTTIPIAPHFEQAKHYAQNPKKLLREPRASAGKTAVYLPKQLPIVLKHSQDQCKSRIEQMEDARKICTQNRFDHLVIPEARICGEFIVESRLPLSGHGFQETIAFYAENRDLFTPAVREFTQFFCQAHLEDLVGTSASVFERFGPIPRYDNIPLYLENGVGRIGLVDLEHFNPHPPSFCSIYSWSNLFYLFPYHIEEILEEVSHFDPRIGNGEADKFIEKSRKAIVEFRQSIYERHLEFIKGHGISLEDPCRFAEISSERREEIKNRVLEKCNQRTDFNKQIVSQMLAHFEHSFSAILDEISVFFTRWTEKNIAERGGAISSYQLLACRTCRTSDDKFDLSTRIENLLPIPPSEKDRREEEFDIRIEKYKIRSLIKEEILSELASGGEIAYYAPSRPSAKGFIFF